jgi:hypothetical protein
MYEHNNTLDPACKCGGLSGAKHSLSAEYMFGRGEEPVKYSYTT